MFASNRPPLNVLAPRRARSLLPNRFALAQTRSLALSSDPLLTIKLSLNTSLPQPSSQVSSLAKADVRYCFFDSKSVSDVSLTFPFSLSSDECLDVTQALDSCGGCASTGEGQDCTKIRGAMSMGCETSKCVVYSCEAGWKPSLAGDKCVRVRSHSSSHNSTAKRHIAARHHLSHGSL